MTPKISACIITYNQEQFIAKTVQAALNQQGSEPYQILIGDDASKDNTFSIAQNTVGQQRSVRFLENTKNHGMHGNWQRCIEECEGEYIALCEGDDYWQDPEKLKKQIALLDRDQEAAACFSNAIVVDENGNASQYPYVDKEFDKLAADEFFAFNFNPIPTCTLVFRKSFFDGFPKEYFESPFADWILHTLLIQKGHYLYLPESTASYRKHSGGIWTGVEKERQLKNKLKALRIIRSLVSSQYESAVSRAIAKQLDQLLYFYRDSGEKMKYAKTWAQLKAMHP